MINSKIRVVSVAMALVFAGVASAQVSPPMSSASLADVEGSVLINRGEQFVAGASGDLVGNGDRVMAMEGSSALLKYDDGCDVEIEPGTVATLSEGSPCAGWLLSVEAVAPSSGLAVGGGVAKGVSPWIYVPAVVVAGVLLYEEFSDDPSSP